LFGTAPSRTPREDGSATISAALPSTAAHADFPTRRKNGAVISPPDEFLLFSPLRSGLKLICAGGFTQIAKTSTPKVTEDFDPGVSAPKQKNACHRSLEVESLKAKIAKPARRVETCLARCSRWDSGSGRGAAAMSVHRRVQRGSGPCWSSVKVLVFGGLGWNSYGTEGAQPVANVRLVEARKTA
jgi:hypothetical protein